MSRSRKVYKVTVEVWRLTSGGVYHTGPYCDGLSNANRDNLVALGTMEASTADICGHCKARYVWERYGPERIARKITKMARGHEGAKTVLEALNGFLGWVALEEVERRQLSPEELWCEYQACGRDAQALWRSWGK